MTSLPTSTCAPTMPSTASEAPRLNTSTARSSRVAIRWSAWFALSAVAVTTLFCLPGRDAIAPSIVRDNAYIFLAADRLYAGHGATSTPPKAPFQPWTWRADWAFLTQWPVGYPLLICGVRALTEAATAKAATYMSVVCCGVGLVAWLAWMLRCVGGRLAGIAVALTASLGAFSVDQMVNPASDTMLLALTPIVLLIASIVLRFDATSGDADSERRPSMIGLVMLGLAAGGLFWIRYAAAFVPAGVGAYLIIAWSISRRIDFRHVAVYGISAAVPVATLIVVNRVMGMGASVQEQLNLGQKAALAFDWQITVDLWRNFTTQTPYAHRSEAFWFFAAILPMIAWTMPLVTCESRNALRRFIAHPAVLLSAAMVASMFALLAAATILFRGKYNFAELDRYYLAIRPFYWLLFVGPLAAMPKTIVRVGVTMMMVTFGAWFVQQDHVRAYQRIAQKQTVQTDYGRWAERFEPNSRELFAWLSAQAGDDLVVFSNFQDDIALETQIPACPVPESRAELNQWLDAIRAARSVDSLRLLFVLEPDNPHRDYFQPTAAQTIETFHLQPATSAPNSIRRHIFHHDHPVVNAQTM